MASAVPYEPDDFDNNPFADNESNDAVSVTPVVAPEEPQIESVAHAITTTINDTHQESNEFSEISEEDLKRYLPERFNKHRYKMAIKITEIESSGNQTSYNPTIKFNAKTQGLKSFRKDTFKDIRRTYRELEAFYRFLIYNNVEVFVPAFPQISSTYTTMSPEWMNCIQTSLQLWFNRVCSNPILIKNHEFSLLFEQPDFGYVPSKTKPAASSIIPTGIKRKTLKQFQPPPDSCEKLAKFRPMIKEVYLNCQKMVEKLERCLKLDRQTAFYVNEFVNEMTVMGRMDPSSEMVRIWNRFHKIISAFNESELINHVSYVSSLIDFFQLLAADCYNIKESLTNRHLLMKEFLTAEENTKKKHNVIDKLKLKSAIDPLKVDEAIRALEVSNKYSKEIHYQVQRATLEMSIESDECMDHFTKKMKQLFALVTQQILKQERKKLNLLLSNKVINKKDSLARLGRESQLDYESLSSSFKKTDTTPNGDSWSSRPKKNFTSANTTLNSQQSLNEEISKVDAKQAASLLSGATF